MIELPGNIRVFDYELKYTFSRSSGPGGQNVNKVNSRATLHWNLFNSPAVSEEVKARFTSRYSTRVGADGEVQVHSDRFRDQIRNKADCLEKLKEMLRSVARPPKKRRPTKPTRSSKERRLTGKKIQSDKKKSRSGSNW